MSPANPTPERDETLTLIERLRRECTIYPGSLLKRFPDCIAANDGFLCSQCEASAALTRESSARRAAERYIKACEAMLREHSNAAAVFQPCGRFHARANLLLGRSAVVEGIAWLTAQLDAAEQRAAQAASLARELHDSGDCGQMLHEIVAVLERP